MKRRRKATRPTDMGDLITRLWAKAVAQVEREKEARIKWAKDYGDRMRSRRSRDRTER